MKPVWRIAGKHLIALLIYPIGMILLSGTTQAWVTWAILIHMVLALILSAIGFIKGKNSAGWGHLLGLLIILLLVGGVYFWLWWDVKH